MRDGHVGKSEVIANFQITPVLLGALWVVDRRRELDTITPRQLRELISEELKVRPTLLSITEALEEGSRSSYDFLNPLGPEGADTSYKINRESVEMHRLVLGKVEKNLIWRLDNIGVAEFGRDLKEAKKEAEEWFKNHSLDQVSVFHPGRSSSDIGFDFLRGGVALRGASNTKPRPQRVKDGADWTKWGAIAAWLIIPITAAGILVAIWLDKN